jgi:hypothetical protein
MKSKSHFVNPTNIMKPWEAEKTVRYTPSRYAERAEYIIKKECKAQHTYRDLTALLLTAAT